MKRQWRARNTVHKIRILVVDDSVAFQQLLSQTLKSDPDLEVVGTAINGRIALEKIPQLRPDVMILDLEMPEMDGLETLAAIRKEHPAVRVIMLSSASRRSAAATVEALSLGASDYFLKPFGTSGVQDGMQRVRDEMVPKIKELCREDAKAGKSFRQPSPLSKRPEGLQEIGIVAIGTSTGGPEALANLFAGLRKNFPVPIVIALHMPALFTTFLAKRLEAVSGLRVREGVAGEEIRPGCAWVAPGEHHMVVGREGVNVRIRLHQEPPRNSCRPSVDVLFESVAKVYGSHALAVVLTGMGKDGLAGCGNIYEAGGRILVQDESSSVVWSMPGSVARDGIADHVLPIEGLRAEMFRRVQVGRRQPVS